MASFTLSPSTPQLSSTNTRVFSPTKRLTAIPPKSQPRGTKMTCHAASIHTDGVPAIERRKLIQLLVFGAVGLPAAGMVAPYSGFFPPSRGGIVAKDEDGNSVIASEWVKVHGPGDRTLAQGLKGDPTYLMVENNTSLATYGINAVCTHLWCIVPWNTVKKKFICPCHGSEYNNEGTVTKGPAHVSLELANVDVEDDKVVFSPWTETDFRTGDAPWWS
ncbi:cytochrome b6-f complex iron-sulfur subunit, chloroplastic-like [Bidens hawaiensis]|uniref:cytochrome b6-f complex iron-sulfur subunit, chloroplastic-like n=1 Tax=Bidens hawaiensis TaxID=980011 RepID=UPI00404AA5B7